MGERKSYDMINIIRLVCAVSVIIIHLSAFACLGDIPYGVTSLLLTRIAVPFFFITSGYFIYSRINEKGYLKKYIFKLLKIYIIMSIIAILITLPLILQNDLTLEYCIKAFFVNGVTPSYWYFPALILSIIFVYIFAKKNWIKPLGIISVVLFAVGLMGDSYYGVVQGTALEGIVNAYNVIFDLTRNGLCIGVPFITLGLVINKYNLNKRIKRLPILIIVFIATLLLEGGYLILNNIPKDCNIYISLAVLVPCIFMAALNSELNINKRTSNLFRNMSLWIYCVHELIQIICIGFRLFTKNTIYNFLGVTLISIVIAYCISSFQLKEKSQNKKKEIGIVVTCMILGMFFIGAGIFIDIEKTNMKNGETSVFNVTDTGSISNIVGPMWKVSNKESNIYIYAANEAGYQNMYPLADIVEDKIKECDGIAISCDESKVSKKELVETISYEGNETLKDHISDEAYQVLLKQIEDTNGNYSKISRYKVKYCYSILDVLYSYGEDEDLAKYSPLNYIKDKALNSDKEVISIIDGLEKLKNYYNVDDDVENAIAMLTKYMDKSMYDNNIKSIEFWEDGNVEKSVEMKEIRNISNEDKDEYEKYHKIVKEYESSFYNKNNEEIANKIEEYINSGKNYFIVIGKNEAVGDYSILNKLRDKGLNIEKVEK